MRGGVELPLGVQMLLLGAQGLSLDLLIMLRVLAGSRPVWQGESGRLTRPGGRIHRKNGTLPVPRLLVVRWPVSTTGVQEGRSISALQ